MASMDNGALLPKLLSADDPESKSASRIRLEPPAVLKTASTMFCPARLSPSKVVAPVDPVPGLANAPPGPPAPSSPRTAVALRGASAVAGEQRPAADGRAEMEQANVIAGGQIARPL